MLGHEPWGNLFCPLRGVQGAMPSVPEKFLSSKIQIFFEKLKSPLKTTISQICDMLQLIV